MREQSSNGRGRGTLPPRRGTVQWLGRALRAKAPELHKHGQAVARLAVSVGRRLGFDEAEIDLVRQAAVLHDIGKLAIGEDVWDVDGPLDDSQWWEVRRHTVVGAEIIGSIPTLQPVAALVRSSHERFDGRGYPDGLAGEEIPLISRVIFACDAYDAMTSQRPYSDPLTVGEALVELRRCAGSQFDPVIVEILSTVVVGELSFGLGISSNGAGPARVTPSGSRGASRFRSGPEAH